MKIKEAHRKTFELYRRVYKRFDGGDVLTVGRTGQAPNYHDKMSRHVWWAEQSDGCSAVEAFTIWDSQARHVRTLEPELLLEALVGKCLLNEQIDKWTGGIDDGAFCLGDFQDLYPWLPDWVWHAVIGQVHKLAVCRAARWPNYDNASGWATPGRIGVREYRYQAEILRNMYREGLLSAAMRR